MPEGGHHDFPQPREEKPVDPDNIHLATAIKAVAGTFNLTERQVARFVDRLADGGKQGVG